MSSVLPEVAPLKGATVFVTGGSGFVGRALIPYLIKHANVKQVRALARSNDAAKIVQGLGATPVRGDLDDLSALRTACTGVTHVFHLAAAVKQWGNYDEIHHDTVDGTQNMLTAARAAGVKRFIHCSTEAVLAGGSGRIINADEKTPIPNASKNYVYSRTKALAEKLVVAANNEEMSTITCRPRFIWGRGDTVVLPILAKAFQTGAFKWCNNGDYRTSHVHIENVCEGFVLAATRGRPGGVYFLADGPPSHFRTFISRYVGTQKVPLTAGSMSFPIIFALAFLLEWIYWVASFFMKTGEPPLTRQGSVLFMQEVSINDALARRELGYTAHKSVDEGMREMDEDYAKGVRLF